MLLTILGLHQEEGDGQHAYRHGLRYGLRYVTDYVTVGGLAVSWLKFKAFMSSTGGDRGVNS